MRAILILFIFLTLVLSATSKNSITFIKLSRRLTRLRKGQICAARKNFDLENLTRQLAFAKDCLSFKERKELQEQCNTANHNSSVACDKLVACPRVGPIQRALNATASATCPESPSRLARVERRWRTRLNRRVRAAGLPKPVYPTIILEPRKKANSALVILHGLGDSAVNRLPLAVELQKKFPRMRMVLPQAPRQFVSLFNETRESWFDILGNTAEAPEAEEEIVAAAEGVNAIAEVQKEVYGIPRKRVGVLGVSQGGGVALTTYLRNEWGAAIGSSTYLPIPSSYPAELGKGSENVELLMIHGRQDMVVPFQFGEISRDIVMGLGRKVRWVALKGDHFLPFKQGRVFREYVKQLRMAFKKGNGEKVSSDYV